MDFHPASSARWDVRLQSRDVEQVRDYLEVNGFTLGIDRRQAPCLDMRTFGVRLPGIYIAYIQYGALVTVRANPRDDYWLLIPIRGSIEAGASEYDLCGDPRRAVAFSYPSIGSGRIRAEANSARIMIKMPPTAINRELTALLGNPPSAPLELAPVIDLTQGYGRSLAGYLGLAFSDFVRGNRQLRNPIAATSFDHFILSALLMSHPHNYSDALRRLDRPITPRAVKRAIDYIEAHIEEPITLADVVHASGVPGRTLLKHFKEYRGVSPMRYLRTARFQRVRDELRRSEPEVCVTDMAIRWGFEHMGRFAVEYRKRFGESPSQTLGKRPRSSP